MIYIKSFKNYEEFKELFKVVKHGNGVESRQNKVLLACLKDRKLFKWWIEFTNLLEKEGQHDYRNYLHAKSMGDLKEFAKYMLSHCVYLDKSYNIECKQLNLFCLGDFDFTLYSPTLKEDTFNGLCADGDTKSIRYINTERDNRVFKMKAGKFISKCIEDNRVTREYMPVQLKRWIGEEFAREWQSYAEQRVENDRYTLYVNHNFHEIYDSDYCKGDFGSCMTDMGYYRFYEDSIDSMAAYITDEEGDIVARCIVYQNVYDDFGNTYRLAERQYSSDGEDVLKQILVDKLISAGAIDGYKVVGASCSDSMNFVLNDGTPLKYESLYIDCNLEPGDIVSYQDSFKYYNHENHIASNDSHFDYGVELGITGGVPDFGIWSEYHGCYIPEDDSQYDEYYQDYFFSDEETVSAFYNGDTIEINLDRVQSDDDFVWSVSLDMYIHYDYAIYVEKDNDYYPESKCLVDYNGNVEYAFNCVYSGYLHSYIRDDEAVFVKEVESYVPYDLAKKCPTCGKWFIADKGVTDEDSEILYCSDDCLPCAEREEEEVLEKELTLA